MKYEEKLKLVLRNNLDNFNRFKTLISNKDVIAIDINKSKIIINKLIKSYCKRNEIVIINGLAYKKENLKIKTDEQLEEERIDKLITKFNDTKKLLYELEKEINESILKNTKIIK